MRVALDFFGEALAGFAGIRETLAKRAGRPVSAQKIRPVTMPLGSGVALEGVWAGQTAVRSKVQRSREARTFLSPLRICMELDDGGRGSSMRFARWLVAWEVVGPV